MRFGIIMVPPFIIWKIIRSLGLLIEMIFRKRIKELDHTAEMLGIYSKNVGRKAFIEHILNELDIFYFSRPEVLSKITKIQTINANALMDKRGKLLFISHFGPNTGIIPALGKAMPYAQVGLSPTDLIKENKITDKTQIGTLNIKERLLRKTNTIFLSQATGLRKALNFLRDGAFVGIAVDGRAGKNFIKTSFLNREAYFSEGPFKLAYLSKALVLPVFPIRESNKILLEFEEPINPALLDLSKDEFITAVMAKYISSLENNIHRNPHQYLYFLYLCRIHTGGKNNALFQ